VANTSFKRKPKRSAPRERNDLIPALREGLAVEPGWNYGRVLPLRSREGEGGKIEMELALPESLRDLATGALDLLEGPYTGRMTPEASNALFNLATAMPKPSGAVGIFGGRLARTADKRKLAQAEQLAANGASREEIFEKTGWFQGVDGAWRFEIPDTTAKLRPDMPRSSLNKETVMLNYGEPRRADQVLDHPELFAAYPELAGIETKAMPLASIWSLRGAYNEPENRLFMSGGNEKDFTSTMLHELQHAVQGREDFARGGNSGQFLPPGAADELAEFKRIRGNYDSLLQDAKINPYTLEYALDAIAAGKKPMRYQQEEIDRAREAGLLDDYASLMAKYRPLKAAQESAYDQYKRLAGEVEARNVENRLRAVDPQAGPDYGEAWLTRTPPYRLQVEGGSMDTPEIDQIILHELGRNSNIKGDAGRDMLLGASAADALGQGNADALAPLGRAGDDRLAHVSPGETVIPPRVMEENPDLANVVFDALSRSGLDPSRYVAGSRRASVNPLTGMPEFFDAGDGSMGGGDWGSYGGEGSEGAESGTNAGASGVDTSGPLQGPTMEGPTLDAATANSGMSLTGDYSWGDRTGQLSQYSAWSDARDAGLYGGIGRPTTADEAIGLLGALNAAGIGSHGTQSWGPAFANAVGNALSMFGVGGMMKDLAFGPSTGDKLGGIAAVGSLFGGAKPGLSMVNALMSISDLFTNQQVASPSTVFGLTSSTPASVADAADDDGGGAEPNALLSPMYSLPRRKKKPV
jgi:hypothetical protein